MCDGQSVVLERTYRASVQEIWDLWTTRDGFMSWWGPQDCWIEVQEFDVRVGGELQYETIAATPAAAAEMEKPWQTFTHGAGWCFSAIEPQRRLALTHTIDFFGGVAPYPHVTTVELFPGGDQVRMVVTLSPLHSPELNERQLEAFTSQLSKLDSPSDG